VLTLGGCKIPDPLAVALPSVLVRGHGDPVIALTFLMAT
jgi:hypothetical protein